MKTHPEQICGNEAISASAGSGKTFQLAHRYVRLLAAGVSADRIVALTFSRKAAAEIFESIVTTLARAAGDGNAARETGARIGLPTYTRAEFLHLLRGFLAHLHRAHVGTLDSFIIGVVRAFPAELGVQPDFRVLDTGSAAAKDVQRQVLHTLFNSPQVGARARHTFLEAFKQATFGHQEKTIDATLDGFIADYRDAFRVLPELEAWGQPDRIWGAHPPWPNCERIDLPDLRAALDRMDLPAQAHKALCKILDFAQTYDAHAAWDTSLDKSRMMQELLAHAGDLAAGAATIRYGRRDLNVEGATAKQLYALIGTLMKTELEKSLRRTLGIALVLNQYEQAHDTTIRRAGTLTFNDAQYLLTQANTASQGALLSRMPNEDGRLYIDFRLDSCLDHWLLDEFQDTSDLQWATLQNLIDEILQDTTDRRSFFYVGDVKQAIYGWRGGNAKLFGNILTDYGARITRRSLTRSFRSCAPVIEAVNTAFADLAGLDLPPGAVKEWAQLWEPHECAVGHVPDDGYAALIDVQAQDGTTKPGPEERRAIVAELIRGIDPLARGLSIAVLVRANVEGKEMVEFLRQALPGTLVSHEGKAPIIDNPVVACLTALITCAAHPGNTLAWRHIQMSPLYPALRRAGLDRNTLSCALLGLIHRAGFEGLIREWGDRLHAESALDDFGRKRLDDLAAAAVEFDTLGSRDCDTFLRFLATYQVDDPATARAVRVMTVHQSKGLGFDVVILPELMGRGIGSAQSLDLVLGMEADSDRPKWALQMPRRLVVDADPVLAEQAARCDENACFDALCVLYVAMTRAKRALYMITGFPGKNSTAINHAALLKHQLAGSVTPEPDTHTTLANLQTAFLFETGNPDWFRAIPSLDTPSFTPPDTDTLVPFLNRESRRTPLVRMEPSAQEAAPRNAAWLFAPESRDVLDFGSAIHRLFQRFNWVADSDPESIIADWQETAAVTADVKRDVAIQFRNALACPDVIAALSRPETEHSPELWLEKRFEIVYESKLITGAFDRVVILRDAQGSPVSATITDFKSNRLTTDKDLRRSVHDYSPQLRMYGDALSTILKLDPADIQLQLLYTRPGRVFAVERA